MKQKCIDKISANLKRAITPEEASAIEAKLNESIKYLSRNEPKWAKMSMQERLMMAAEREKKTIVHDAKKLKQRAALDVAAKKKVLDDYENLKPKAGKPYKAIYKILNNADIYVRGLHKQMFSSMVEAIELSAPKWFGLVENKQFADNFYKELYNEGTTDISAKKAADAWLLKSDELLNRFNNNGGDIGKLDYNYIPTAHNVLNMVKHGKAAWVADFYPLIKRDNFKDIDGYPLSNDQFIKTLGDAYDTLTTGGLNKFEPGKIQPGITSSLAKRQDAKHRVFHFINADAHIKYNEKYGSKSLMGNIESHIGRMARDIGLIEQFGPNPDSTFNLLHDTAKKDGGSDLTGLTQVRTRDMWSVLSGKTSVLNDPSAIKIASFMRNWRALEVIGKLQKTMLSALIDLPTYYHTAFHNGEDVLSTTTHLINAFGKENKHYAAESGLVLESMVNGMNTWADATMGSGLFERGATATIKVSLLEAWTDTIRTAAHTQYMGVIGRLSKTDWQGLHAEDRARLEAKGITPDDWAILNLAKLETRDNLTMMTRQAIEGINPAILTEAGFTQRQAEMANTRILGFIADEAEYASLAPNLETRAAMTRSTQAGTFGGELIRALGFFKSFPTAMMTRHIERMIDTPHASKTKYIGTLLTGLMVFSAIQIQVKELLAGRDPLPINSVKFWSRSLLQSGGLGFLGDVIYQLGGSMQSLGGTSSATNLASAILGPQIGSGLEAIDLTLGNAFKAMQQKSEGKEVDTHFGAEAVRLARSHTPFVNLWYLSTAIDHAGIQDLQEFLSPGYLARVEERALKNNQQRYFIQPGSSGVVRSPDFWNIIQ